MAKDRRKLQHIHSSIKDRQPTPATLEVGEIAVNNNADNEFLSLKNSNDRVVRFSSDEQLVTIMEKKEVMPYVGYVRGGAGPSATAEGSTADTYGSYGIENSDLINNTSEIIIKLNQVAADNTTKHDKVNGAKDKYSKDVNPTTDGGLNDGAGFFIDMSRYAMQDANPRFSGITNTCYTTLNGTTKIHGLTGDCGSLLDIKVDSAKTDIETATTEITSAKTTIGTNDTTISADTKLSVSGNTTINREGNVSATTTGTTTLRHKDDVTVNNEDNYTTNTTGNTTFMTTGNTVIHSEGSVGITARGELTAMSTEADMQLTADKDLCATAGDKATIYGDNTTNVGLNCDNSVMSPITNVMGETTNVSANTMNVTATTSFTVTTGDLCLTSTGDADFGGDTNTRIGTNCEGAGISNNTTIYASTAVTINAPVTNITGNTNISGNTIIGGNTYISGITTIGDTLIIKKGLEKKLSWSYGNVQSATADSTNFKEDKSFVIPQCAGDIKRRTLSWSNGAANTGSYDPGASCDNTDSGTNIVVPSGLSHLTDWSNNCLNVANNLCVNGTVTATGGMYTSSDRDLKENITYIGGHDISKATRIKLKAFNYRNDPSNRKVYGVIAQDLEEIGLNELVHYDENGMRSVDYTGLLLLKLAALEKEIDILKHKLEEKNN